MIKIENAEVGGWEAAIRGMRNPMDSWDKSDSTYQWDYMEGTFCTVGPNDLDLMMRLAERGHEHAKYRRFIDVTADWTAPLYFWKEADTYKHIVSNSCSTMHRIHAKPFTLDDFSHEHLTEWSLTMLEGTVDQLNVYRCEYVETKDKTAWWQLIQLLPSSYNQRRTLHLNYEVLAAIYRQRRNHRLDEWHAVCDWVETLPYAELITAGVGR